MLLMPLPIMAATPSASFKPQYLPPIAPQLDTSAFPAQPAPVTRNNARDSYNDAPMQADSRDYEATQPAPEPVDRVKELLKQALVKHNQGDRAGAQKLFKQVLSMDPRNGDANFNLGAMAEDAGDLNGAQHYYRAAAAANPGDSDVRDALAAVDQRLQQQAQARETANQVAKKNQLRQVATEAATAYKSGNYDKAIQLLEQIDREAPGDANVKYGLGQAYRGKGDMQRANANLQAAASLAPDNQLYRNTLTELSKQQQQVARQPQSSPSGMNFDDGAAMPSGGRDYGQTPPVANDYRQAGDLTPFNGGGNEQLYGHAYDNQPRYGGGGIASGLGSALGIGGLGMGLSSLMGGRSAVPYGGGSRGSRLVRGAVTGGLSGAVAGALGGMVTGGRGAMKSGAMKGAMYGGLFGMLSSF
jgi:tetratricopeptide (TPR) repeat protein